MFRLREVSVRIIYYSYWGTYAAYLMAALHAGIYPTKELPSHDRIDRQYELCHRYAEQAGNLIYVGLDDRLREVYSLGCRQHGAMLRSGCNSGKAAAPQNGSMPGSVGITRPVPGPLTKQNNP